METHPFTFKVDLHPLRLGRYRWIIFDYGSPIESSTVSFDTVNEATTSASERMQSLISQWRERAGG